MFSAYSPRAANAYQRINVETSMHTIDQHRWSACCMKVFSIPSPPRVVPWPAAMC